MYRIRILTTWLLTLAMVSGIATLARADNNEDWQLRRDKSGIKVFTRTVVGSAFKAVKSSVTISADVHDVVDMIRDPSTCPTWADRCEEAYIVEQLSESEHHMYMSSVVPWPLVRRDAVLHVRWFSEDSPGIIRMSATAVNGVVDKKPSTVRLTHATHEWSFESLSDGKVLVTNIAHIDPGGPVPGWLMNLLLVDSPYQTMNNIRRHFDAAQNKAHSPEF